MYTLVRRFIKTGIGFLFVGLAIGGWMQVQRDILHVWPDPYLRSAVTVARVAGELGQASREARGERF